MQTGQGWNRVELAVASVMRYCDDYNLYGLSVAEIAQAVFGQADSVAKRYVRDALLRLEGEGLLFVDVGNHRPYGRGKLYGIRSDRREAAFVLTDRADLPEVPMALPPAPQSI